MKIKYLLLTLSLGSFYTVFSQETPKDSIIHQAEIVQTIDKNKVHFKAKLSPLRQIAGAPKAFWSTYWEFGDGDYSFQENPSHQYKDKGEYEVRLAATNNYDDGKPPLTRPKKTTISSIDSNDVSSINEEHHLLDNHHGLRLQNNRDPKPAEEMQVILSYGNDQNYPTNGKLYVFFNEKKYKANNFVLTDVRTYHNEEETEGDFVSKLQDIPSKNELIKSTGIATFVNQKFLKDTTRLDLQNTLDTAKLFYREVKVWNVDNVNPKEERNIFLTLKTTPEMLKDTSAIITIRSIYVPERGKTLHKITEKEMEIVTSHDPNKMAVYQSFLNYRLVRFKRLKYKVKFQNNGEGPASLIKLNVDIPEMLDKTTLKLIDMYPKVPVCPKNKKVSYSCMDTIIMKDKISFQFKNIYLPGTAQKGVMDKDSTKGFVKYSLKFAKDFHKVKSKSKTEIIFDKNDPIITNTSTSRFTPGLSIGAKAGYNYFFNSNQQANFDGLSDDIQEQTKAKGYFVGATFSPYKSYKWYLQGEFMASYQEITSEGNLEQLEDTSFGFEAYAITKTSSEIINKYIDIVPVSIRYNFNAIFAAGAGLQGSFNFNQKTTSNFEKRFYFYQNNQIREEITDLKQENHQEVNNQKINLNNYGLFLDVTAGASRIGPSVGVRYIQNFKEPTQQIHAYVIWKF